MNSLTLFSPAKLNLFFRVLKKRPDTFHDIVSLYQTIDLGDRLTLSLSQEKDTLTCTNSTVPTDKSNLILRAAELFRKKTGKKATFSFVLDKKIPIEAGLGGGSSNAATALWGLNQLMGLNIPDQVLSHWGAELGSDVPFFLTKGRALCEGRGEIVTPQAFVEQRRIWLAKPKKMGLSTPTVYAQLQVEELKNRDPKQVLLSHSSSTPIFFNDLEASAFQLLPPLLKIKEALLELGFKQVHMTGSGTTFFCLGEVKAPKLTEVTFYRTSFIERSSQGWYKFPS